MVKVGGWELGSLGLNKSVVVEVSGGRIETGDGGRYREGCGYMESRLAPKRASRRKTRHTS